jgi:hypothetical protein
VGCVDRRGDLGNAIWVRVRVRLLQIGDTPYSGGVFTIVLQHILTIWVRLYGFESDSGGVFTIVLQQVVLY